MEIKNPYVSEFYKQHDYIDFEKANVLLVDLFKTCILPEKLQNKQGHLSTDVCAPNTDTENDYDLKQNSSAFKSNSYTTGVSGEKKIEQILNKLNPMDEIIENINEDICCDFVVMSKTNPYVLVNNVISETNVKSGEIDFFTQSCKKQKCNGILMSQHTGITGKKNFEMDIIGNNVIIYMHCVEYDEDKINFAFEIMNKLYSKIKTLNVDNNDTTISKEILQEINKEYQLFVTQKQELQKYVKNNQTQLLNQIDNIKFTNLTTYLSRHFTNIDKKGIHKCNLCNFYTSNTLKGIAAHKQGCKKKHPTEAH